MKPHPCSRIILTTAILGLTPVLHAVESIRVVDELPSEGKNTHYVSNKPPLRPSPLIKLPLGAIRPEGWIRRQLELMADGMTGRLSEISPWLEFKGNAWADLKGQGEHGWEELPYWLKGFIDLGYVLDDQRIIKESKKWVEAVIAGQRPDGYFGDEKNRQVPDLWPNMVMLYAVRTYYEATNDKRVLVFMSKYFKWESKLPLGKFLPSSWQKVRGGDNLDSIYWLYNRTGEAWLLDLARVCHEVTGPWTQDFPTWHGVNITQGFREPAEFYEQVDDVRYLRSTENRYAAVMDLYGQVPGGMFGADENARPGFTGPRQGAETCSMVEFMYSFEYLLKITGSAIWADRCENVAFNSLPAAMTPDFKGLHYLTAANQVQLDRTSKSPLIQNGDDMFSYTPYEQYRCCQHNVSHGWPYYSEHLWLATPGNGLAAVMYGACGVKAKVAEGVELEIAEKTNYPFDEHVEMTLTLAKSSSFPLVLRVPQWCEGFAVRVNDQKLDFTARSKQWVIVDRTWSDRDVVKLDLPMTITTTVWTKNHNTISINRGPLTYSLLIEEDWRAYENGKSWKAYEVFPKSPWNYGLVVDAKNPAASINLTQRSASITDMRGPWTVQGAPIALKAKAKRIPQWKLEANGLIGEVQQSPVASDQPEEEITLIPMGAARLRVSAFPTIGPGAPAATNAWKPADVLVSASAVGTTDSLSALNDGVVPQSSNDARAPRFTWWDNRGTAQWVQYVFPVYRKISSSEVFWYDDTGSGECRTPHRWHLMYADGKKWKEVKATSEYGTAKDQFNRVTFEPISTNRLRLFAEFQPEYSAGILEWRVAGDE